MRHVKSRSLSLNLRGLCAAVLQIANGSQTGLDDFVDAVTARCSEDPRLLTRGHDFLALFAYGLKRAWGSYSAADASVVEAALLASFALDDLMQTQLAAEITRWELSNPGFRVL